MEQPFFFDPEALAKLAAEYRASFAQAQPFPHVVIDGVIPDDILEQVVAEAPAPHEHKDWLAHNHANAVKLSIADDWTLGPVTRHVLNQFNSAVFINFLEQLTDITGLIPDPHYLGGGLHQIERGGFLSVHADFNRHKRLLLDRRLNAIVYLNHDWQDEWGGHLELWNREMTEKVEAVAPVFNRMVIFATTDTGFHGHPDPLECPPGVRRRSLALYYYTNGRPEHEQSAAHTTLHQVRRGKDHNRDLARKYMKEFVPPIAIRAARKARERIGEGNKRKVDD
ncbi:MAG: 2OG-Fe(II) oxygenase [Acidimicrobiales bacterium]